VDGVLRVASYNVRDLKDDVDAAARVVRAIEPDVLCLQEVPRHPFSGHRVAELARRCGLMWSGGHRGSGGTTILTALRVDVRGARHEGLPVGRRQRERGYAVATVALPGGAMLDVVSVHLSLDADERARHAGDLQFWGILAGLVGGPLMLVYLVLFNREGNPLWMLAAVGLTVAGFGLLVQRLPRHRDDDDDGAVL